MYKTKLTAFRTSATVPHTVGFQALCVSPAELLHHYRSFNRKRARDFGLTDRAPSLRATSKNLHFD
jgi:hypothetical protein